MNSKQLNTMVLRQQLSCFFFFEPVQPSLPNNAHRHPETRTRRHMPKHPRLCTLRLLAAPGHTLLDSPRPTGPVPMRVDHESRGGYCQARCDLFFPSGFQKASQVWRRDSRTPVSSKQIRWQRAKFGSQFLWSAIICCTMHTQ